MNLFDLDDKVTAAAVAAAGTVIGSLIQLRVSWRKEVSERARGVPATKKSRRGPVLAVGLLLVGAAAGGFAFSQYLVKQSDLETAALRGQLETQLAQISATAARLERVALSEHGASARMAENRDAEGVAATTTVGPCRARVVVAPDATPACDEQEAQQVTLCASVPALAVVTAIVLYARPEDSPQPWSESRVDPGHAVGRARFADKAFERAESDQTKQVWTAFSSWDGEHGYSARLVVKFLTTPGQARSRTRCSCRIPGWRSSSAWFTPRIVRHYKPSYHILFGLSLRPGHISAQFSASNIASTRAAAELRYFGEVQTGLWDGEQYRANADTCSHTKKSEKANHCQS